MSSCSVPHVLVLGASGRFGRSAVQAFASAGWHVTAQSRRPLPYSLPAGASFLRCDASQAKNMIEGASETPDVVVNALNPEYGQWERQVPLLAQAALGVAQATGALLMLPGNVYNFGSRLPERLAETTPFQADTTKARIRMKLEQDMERAAESGVRSVVIRAGDFIGGPGPGTWLDLVIAKKLDRRRFVYPGPLDVQHAWAYLPDLARVFVAVAERREQLAAFEVLHYEGISCTGNELCQAMEQVAGHRLSRRQMPWWPLRLMGPLLPMARALLEMRYLWLRPHRLDGTRLARLISDTPRTDLHQVVRSSLAAAGLSAKKPAQGAAQDIGGVQPGA